MLTFSELVKRVAELSGSAYYTDNGQGRAEVPIDQHDLDKCKRVVNDAMRTFIADAPIKGWRWMRRLAAVTFAPDGEGPDNINEDPARYYLPQFFGGTVDGPIRYAAGTPHTAHIEWADEGFIRAQRAPVVNTGHPLFAAILPHEPATQVLTPTRRWELIVDPKPVAEHTVEFPYTLYFDDMHLETGEATGGSNTTLEDTNRAEPDDYFEGWVLRVIDGAGSGQTGLVTDYTAGTFTFEAVETAIDDTSVYAVEPAGNLHPAGQQFDSAVLDAAKAESEKQFEDVLGNFVQYYRQVSLPNAHALDARSAPRTLGPKRVSRERVWENVQYHPRT